MVDCAPGLIAAKPVKPCDGGVFGALDWLPKKERKRAHPGRARLAFCVRRPALSGVRHKPARKLGFMGRLQGGISPGAPCITAGKQPVSQLPPTRHKPAFFATTSIATKPVKPCDGGVFGALNSLLKRERKRAHPGRVCLALCACRPALSGVRHKPARKPGFMGRLQGKGAPHFARRALHHGGQAAGFATAARLPQASIFRYHFDSNKARQTVRWRRFSGRFGGLELAPEKRAAARGGAGWLSRCGLRFVAA